MRFDSECGGAENGLKLLSTTDYPQSMDVLSSLIVRIQPSIGHACWRKPMPSNNSRNKGKLFSVLFFSFLFYFAF